MNEYKKIVELMGTFYVEDEIFDNAIDTFSYIFNMNAPFREYEYCCTYINKQLQGESDIIIRYCRDFKEIVDIAYDSTGYFKCTGLNNNEQAFIDKIFEYKITEKLKS